MIRDNDDVLFMITDWDRLDAQLRQSYCANQGPPGHPPLVMLQLELLRYFFNLSDRQVIDRCRTDLLFRYFLQIGVTSNLPHPTSLTYFRGRLGADASFLVPAHSAGR